MRCLGSQQRYPQPLSHIMSVAEMPSHTHNYEYNGVGYSGWWPSNASGGNISFYVGQAQGYNSVYIQRTGGSQPHSLMQPYMVVTNAIRV